MPSLLKQAELTGRYPKALEARPELDDVQQALYEAWNEIGSTRSFTTAGPLPVSLTGVKVYADLYGLNQQDAVDLWKLVRQIDAFYLDEINRRNPPPTATKGGAKK